MNKFIRTAEDHFAYHDDFLYVEQVKICDMIKEIKTPFYLYSCAAITEQFNFFNKIISVLKRPKVFYAIKANSNIAVLSQLAHLGAGFDVVSGGEISRVEHIGADCHDIVFSGVGKSIEEIDMALQRKIMCFNVESIEELNLLQQRAQSHNMTAPVAIRINPDIAIKGNEKISTGRAVDKFGIDAKTAFQLYKNNSEYSNLKFAGIAMHIGSQITDVSTFKKAYGFMNSYAKSVADLGIKIQHLDVGGGFGIEYNQNPVDEVTQHNNYQQKQRFADELAIVLKDSFDGFNGDVFFEPGRFIVANAGILVMRILYLKQMPKKNFIIVDAAMNNLIRPTLYNQKHSVIPLNIADNGCQKDSMTYDIAGPICESGDYLAKDIRISSAKKLAGLAILSAGAYGAVLASTYNSRSLIAEYMISKSNFSCIKNSYDIHQQLQSEHIFHH